jgi:hypothetical protein
MEFFPEKLKVISKPISGIILESANRLKPEKNSPFLKAGRGDQISAR